MKQCDLQPLPKTFFPFLWHFVKQYPMIIGIYILCAISAGISTPMHNKLVNFILDSMRIQSYISVYTYTVLIICNFAILYHVAWRIIGFLSVVYIPKIQSNIINQVLQYVLLQTQDFYNNTMSGVLAKHVDVLVNSIQQIIPLILPNMIRFFIVFCIIIYMIFNRNIWCGSLFVLWSLFYVLVNLYRIHKSATLSSKVADHQSIINGQVVDVLSHHTNVKAFAKLNDETIRIKKYVQEYKISYQKSNMYTIVYTQLFNGIMIILLFACTVYILIVAHMHDAITIGYVAFMIGTIIDFGYFFWFLNTQYTELVNVMGQCNRSLEALMQPIKIVDAVDAATLHCTEGEIKFENVQFSYQENDKIRKFEYDVTIKPGEKVGLVGASGSGKSTLVSLLLRLYDTTTGSIEIDGYNIKDVSQNSLRSNISVVSQDQSLFDRTIMENIRYGKANATDAEVIEAAKKAHVDDFVQNLPDKYDTIVGERSVKLSGGQRQRVAIARAILKNAPILILDETTSQLDAETEKNITDSIWDIMKDKTAIVIAHRLSTIKNMDRILVLDQGRIVDQGTHDELIEKDGIYKNLCTLQNGGVLNMTQSSAT